MNEARLAGVGIAVCCICGEKAVGSGSGLFSVYCKNRNPRRETYAYCSKHEAEAREKANRSAAEGMGEGL